MFTTDDKSRNYDFKDVDIDPRFKRCELEMKLTFGTWIVYALSSIGISYGVSWMNGEKLVFVFGIPTWFFWGECVTALVFFIVVCFISKKVFKDMELFD